MEFERVRQLIVCGLLCVLAAATAAAQDTGTVSGTIVDQSGQVLPGATVTLVNEATGGTRTLVSDERGDFGFRAVQPGAYTVIVELASFRRFEQRQNVVNANGQLALGAIMLQLGGLNETVAVTAQGTTIETTNSDYSALLTDTQIAQIQTKGRDVVSLLRLLPGVHYEDDVEALGDSFGSALPNISGQRKTWNQVTVDGLNGNELSGTNRMNSSVNLDAIAEVKVLLNTYKAEFGHTAGANIQVVTKSGSAQYRGSAYYYARRDAWNATPWENNRAGVPKPKYHIDTPGFSLGGPLAVPRTGAANDPKLFFFYSFEAPYVQKPGPLRLYRMPTARERAGDFSQTYDSNGRPIYIRDPSSGLDCATTAGGPGCFPGNVIPANRLDPNALALLNLLPLPNAAGESATYNFRRQETSTNPRMNHVLRLDARPSGNNTLYATVRTFSSAQYGSEITAAPARWGFFNGSYTSGDRAVNGGWNHVSRGHAVNELQAGVRRAYESFGVADDSDWSRLRRTDVGYALPQFSPPLNPLGLIPKVTFGVGTTGVTSPDFTWDDRIGATAFDWLTSARETFTWTHARHTFKVGGHFEYMQNTEARGGAWSGQITFNNSSTNPLNTNFAFSNAVLGVYSQYTETDAYRGTDNRQWWTEWYAQDTWQAAARLTIDYGVRFLFYSPYWRPDGRLANFDPARYDPSQAPRLYVPSLVNGTKVAYDPVTGSVANVTYVGTYVPGTGNEANGMILATDPRVPRGFRGVNAPAPEPRLGATWDPGGAGRTIAHASAGVFHNARLGGGSLGNLASNPPFVHNPIIFNNSLSTTFVPGVTLANRPVAINALETDYDTPISYNWSAGVRREIGWGTAVDATYTGYAAHHMEMSYDINGVPDGARLLAQHPENHDPTGSATTVLAADFLRPYRGYQNIRVRGNFGDADYHALQVQVNRRYIRGLQFGAAYTLQRARGLADEDPGNVSFALNRPASFFYAELGQSNRHSLVVNYSWELPGGRRFPPHSAAGLLLAGWQLSGENAFVSGDWNQIVLATSDNFDFTGGDGGTGGCLQGSGDCLRVVRPVVVGNPMAGGGNPLSGWFNVSAFQRPSGVGDYGNSPRNVVQQPGVRNWNLSLFKNVRIGASRTVQYRLEAYNLLNATQFRDVDRTARFDPAGNQINPTFGTAIGISNPTRAPRVIQMSLRFSF